MVSGPRVKKTRDDRRETIDKRPGTSPAYNDRVTWTLYFGSIGFFTLLLGVFLAVAYSVLLGVRENYLRYYQKSELQWTGTGRSITQKRIPLFKVILSSFLLAWLIVHFIIMP